MQSPLKKIIVYDLETGGLKSDFNSITEIAMVAIDLETLEIIDTMSVLLRPVIDLRGVADDSSREAKILIKELAVINNDTGIKSVLYKDSYVTLKNYDTLIDDIDLFYEEILEVSSGLIEYEQYLKIREDERLKDIAELFFNKCYNPQALEITQIPIKLLLEEGVGHEEAVKQVVAFFQKHTIGTKKPILAGHNIEGFDNDFFKLLLSRFKFNLDKLINRLRIDTLDWVRLKWFEMPSFNLGTCVNEVGLTLKMAHRALPDTEANAKLLIKILKSLRGEGTQESNYVRKKYDFNF